MAIETMDAPEESMECCSHDEVIGWLRQISSLEGLRDEDYEWLAEHGTLSVVPDGQIAFRGGEPVHEMNILLSGEVHVRRMSGPIAGFIGRSGNLGGKLPFSRMRTFGGDGYAVGTVRSLQIHERCFHDMLAAIPSMAERCVHTLLDRTREVTRMEQQAEKLNALGKLAANLSHELNNPASAARSAANSLSRELRTYGNQKFMLGSLGLSDEETAAYRAWATEVFTRMQNDVGPDDDAIATAEREDEFVRWLEGHEVPDAWRLASTLASISVTTDDLDKLAATTAPKTVAVALASFLSGLRAERMSQTVVEASERIFDFITAIKDYSYMDQAPIQEIDVAQSLEAVLVMFASRMTKVRVVREIAPVLPPVSAYGSELNQVFAELIENALDAMNDCGTLTLRAKVSGPMVFVEVCDSGTGIAREHLSRIFEPFFSTKNNGGMGTGLGLGLDQANRVVLKHSGQLTVTSEPGNTCFAVRLPIEPVGAY